MREKARQKRMFWWLMMFVCGICLIAAGVVILDEGDEAFWRWSWAAICVGVLMGPVGLVMALRNGPNADTDRVRRIGGYRDIAQRQKVQSILIMPITTLFLSFRHKALGLGLLVLVLGMVSAFGLAMWRPFVGIAAMPLVLAVASASAAIRYWMLNRQADPNG